MQNQWGPLKVWQWGAAVLAAVVLYYLYRTYQSNNQAANAQAGTSTGNILDPTTGLPFAGSGGFDQAYQSLQSQIAAMTYDPTTGQPYYQEFQAALAAQTANQAASTTAEQAMAAQIASLEATIAGLTPIPVPAPVQTPPPPAGGGTTPPPSGSGGNNQSTTPAPIQIGLSPSPSSPALTSSIMHSLSVSQQIQLVLNGSANKSLLGPNALKIYNAGGLSTALPTRAAVLAANAPTGAPPGAFL